LQKFNKQTADILNLFIGGIEKLCIASTPSPGSVAGSFQGHLASVVSGIPKTYLAPFEDRLGCISAISPKMKAVNNLEKVFNRRLIVVI